MWFSLSQARRSPPTGRRIPSPHRGGCALQFLGKINELLSLTAKSVFIVFLVCWTLALSTEPTSTLLSGQFRSWVWVGAKASTVWLVGLLAWDLATRLKTRHENFKILKTLSPVERALLKALLKALLNSYLTNNTTSITLVYGAGVPMGLVQKASSTCLVKYLSREGEGSTSTWHPGPGRFCKSIRVLCSDAGVAAPKPTLRTEI